ncbi:MAG: SRPBCC family protein [Thiohalocapsa sp.]|nr:SRPBCC family protein [Thiohalocapsa sp.]MCF7989421.1 SRPBCC family protein [Thiohalocapsa sp.]
MLYLLLLPLGIVAVVLIYLALQPGEIRARKSLVIARERAEIFDTVTDLRTWRVWSPWLLHEPDARLDYSDSPDRQGGWYAWDGRIIGAGKLKHLRLERPERIEQRISFTRPFKSTAAVSWEFVEQPSGTEVFWTLRGRMPFMLRFLAPIMSEAVGKDYQLGLALLRAHLDPDAPQLQIRFVGEREHPEHTAWTIPFAGGMDEMVKAMEEGFARLAAAASRQGLTPAGTAFTAYHMADPKSGRFACDLALPVPEGTDAGDFEIRRLGGGRYYLTEVQGSYDFLEPVWYSVMAHLRMAKYTWDRKRPSLEVYVRDPSTAKDDNDILTRIYVPIR